MLNGEKYDEPAKILSKRQWENKFFKKSDGKLNYWELTFLSGSAWKHITEMPAKVFLELTLKVSINYFCIQYGVFWAESQISIKNSTQSWNP